MKELLILTIAILVITFVGVVFLPANFTLAIAAFGGGNAILSASFALMAAKIEGN